MLTGSFKTKIIIATISSVIIGMIFSVAVAVYGIFELSKKSSDEISDGLQTAYKEYLFTNIDLTGERIGYMFDRALSDINILTGVTQTLFDHAEDKGFPELFQQVSKTPFFNKNFVYNPDGNWTQNKSPSDSVVSVWGHLLDEDKQIYPEVSQRIQETALLDLIMPSIKEFGAEKQWIYYGGPKDGAFLRLTPYTNMAQAFDDIPDYKGHNDNDFWTFFFPGLIDSWETWPVKNNDITTLKPMSLQSKQPLSSQITVTPPYEDAAGSGIIVSFFHPLWSQDRSKFEGAIGLDFNLTHIIDFIRDVKLATSGFAFLARKDGTVLAVGGHGEKVLGLQNQEDLTSNSAGISVLARQLSNSSFPEFAQLELPIDDDIKYLPTVDANGKSYVVTMKRVAPLNYYLGEDGIEPEYLSLGFVVPRDEIFASLFAAQTAMLQSRQEILLSEIIVIILTLLVVFFIVLKLANTLTQGIQALSQGAEKIQNKNYDVVVQVDSQDEIGKLGETFNLMAKNIYAYTTKLEDMVASRTQQLEKANEKIGKLNKLLTKENVRLSAEVNVARRIQEMVLPKTDELGAVSDLDIAGYMSAADEVGGDYYDVLQDNNHVWIGIGDVTGHGLESGVMMLMTQTAVRTLQVNGESDIEKFYSTINKVMYKNNHRTSIDRFMTFSLLDYHGAGKFTLTGQHEDGIIVRSDGSVEYIDTMDLGVPIALDEDINDFIDTKLIQLMDSDILVLHTDGITEAENMQNEQYGIQKLADVIVESNHLNSEEIKTAIISSVMNHIGEQKIFDDITLIVLKKKATA